MRDTIFYLIILGIRVFNSLFGMGGGFSPPLWGGTDGGGQPTDGGGIVRERFATSKNSQKLLKYYVFIVIPPINTISS